MVIHIPKIEIFSQKEMVIFKPQGLWTAKTARDAEPLCTDILKKSLPNSLIFDLAALKHFDTSGVWLLHRTVQELEQKGHQVELRNQTRVFQTLLARLDPYKPSFENVDRPHSFFEERIVELGKTSIFLALLTRDLTIFLGEVVVGFFLTLFSFEVGSTKK